tara:strand:+ start:5673 stop:6692 length:1020 start_codon:yes stop_codon:yes gene_type:complete
VDNINKQVKDFHSSLMISDYITSYNLARQCDVVFAEELTPDQFDKLEVDKNNIEVIKKDQSRILYRTKKFNLNENDVIFCKTDLLPDLFSILYNQSGFTNIKLLSHQAATPSINEGIFKLKPKIISKWFSINIDFKHDDLIPIPLGIANEYATQNIRPYNFIEFFEKNKNVINYKKQEKIYINFNKNTNILKRQNILDKFLVRKDITNKANLPLNEFMIDMFKHKFILSPQGKGIDTHRFWEALYLGSVPIIEDHPTFGEYLRFCISHNEYGIEDRVINKEMESFNLDFSLLTNFLTVSYLINKIKELKINNEFSRELNYGIKEKILKRFVDRKFKSQN